MCIDMARVCNRHPFLLSENLCGRCGIDYCRDCLVFPRGQKLPLCTKCAIAASGVRGSTGTAMSKRQLRSRVKERERDVATPAPEALPDIANPLPKGFAFEDTDAVTADRLPTDHGTAAEDTTPKRARRLPRSSRSADAGAAEPEEDNGAEMMSFLDSVYGSD